MKYFLSILALVSFSSCGKLNELSESSKTVQIEKELQPYVNTFLDESKRHGRAITIDNLVVQFGTLNQGVIGMCSTKIGQSPTITFSYEWYNYYLSNGLYSDIEQVMLHELGHCVLNLGHNDTKDSNNMPVSIMNTYHFNSGYYDMHRVDYLNQLFSK